MGKIGELFQLLEKKDLYTAIHCKNVAIMTEQFSKVANMKSNEAKYLIDAALLHDLGKLYIQDELLKSRNKLTDYQYDIIKEHCKIGYNIAKEYGLDTRIAEIILHHHENWNGQGYPNKIAGNEIPIGARIISILDSIDAMCGIRYYKDSMYVSCCKNEIIACCGSKYDPNIVRFVLEHWNDIIIQYDKL